MRFLNVGVDFIVYDRHVGRHFCRFALHAKLRCNMMYTSRKVFWQSSRGVRHFITPHNLTHWIHTAGYDIPMHSYIDFCWSNVKRIPPHIASTVTKCKFGLINDILEWCARISGFMTVRVYYFRFFLQKYAGYSLMLKDKTLENCLVLVGLVNFYIWSQ